MKKVPKLDFCYLFGRSALEKGGSSSFQNHQWNRKSSHFFLFPLSRSLSYNRSSISFPWCSVICLCTLRMKKPFYADLARETNWVNIQKKERRSGSINTFLSFFIPREYKQKRDIFCSLYEKSFLSKQTLDLVLLSVSPEITNCPYKCSPIFLSCALTWIALPLFVPIPPSVLSKYNFVITTRSF